MNRKQLMRWIFIVLLVPAILSGILQNGPDPAMAIDCPNTYYGCHLDRIECDTYGSCCCFYFSSKGSSCTSICD